MSFERFKHEIKKMDIDRLNKEIQERKKTLMKWNIDRTVDTTGYDHSKKVFMTYSKHPYRKIRKELAILNNEIHNRNNKL